MWIGSFSIINKFKNTKLCAYLAYYNNKSKRQLLLENKARCELSTNIFWSNLSEISHKICFDNQDSKDTPMTRLVTHLLISVLAIHQSSCQSNTAPRNRWICVACSCFRVLCWWPHLHQTVKFILVLWIYIFTSLTAHVLRGHVVHVNWLARLFKVLVVVFAFALV